MDLEKKCYMYYSDVPKSILVSVESSKSKKDPVNP